MIIKYLLVLLLYILPQIIFSQRVQVIEEKARRMADHIVDQTERNIVIVNSEKIVDSSFILSHPDSCRLASGYLEWYYPNGVLNIAMKRLAKALGEKEYNNYVSENYHFIMSNYRYFENSFKPGEPYESYFGENYSPYWQIFMMSELDHCGAMGAGLVDEYYDNENECYLEMINKIADYISNKQVRLKDGTLVRYSPREYSLWTDDLFMSVPFLSRMGYLTGKEKYYNDAGKQFKQFRKYVFNEEKDIYHHFWFSDTVVEPFAYWGRANGWAIMALTEFISYLPEEYPEHNYFIKFFRKHISGIITYQDESGLWHQLLNKDDSYLETSCTSMFLYAIARGIRKGWIDDSYKKALDKGWEGLVKKINDKGVLSDICVGTPIGMDIEFYYERPKSDGDTHGTAAAIMAASEYIILHNEY